MKTKNILKLGIVGGMGVEAGMDFERVVSRMFADAHARVSVALDNREGIPDRTTALLSNGPNFVQPIAERVRSLVAGEATHVVIACHTAHTRFGEIRALAKKAGRFELLNLVDLSARAVQREASFQPVGVLCTRGTSMLGTYSKAFHGLGVREVAVFEAAMRAHNGIYKIKEGRFEEGEALLLKAAHQLVDAGAKALLMGCTDVPITMRGIEFPVPLIDPAQIVAREMIRLARVQGTEDKEGSYVDA